jgi:hypothetical protein
LAPDLARVGGEREQVGAGGVEVLGGVGEPLGQRGDDPVELGMHRFGVGLVEDGAHLGGYVRLRRLRDFGEQVAQVVGATPLPGRAGQRRPDRRHQAGVGVGDDQLHPGQPAGDEPAQKRQPARAVLTAGHVEAAQNPTGSRGGRRR